MAIQSHLRDCVTCSLMAAEFDDLRRSLREAASQLPDRDAPEAERLPRRVVGAAARRGAVFAGRRDPGPVPGHAPGLGGARRHGGHVVLPRRVDQRAPRRQPGAPRLAGRADHVPGQPRLERKPGAPGRAHAGAAFARRREPDAALADAPPTRTCWPSRPSSRARAASRTSNCSRAIGRCASRSAPTCCWPCCRPRRKWNSSRRRRRRPARRWRSAWCGCWPTPPSRVGPTDDVILVRRPPGPARAPSRARAGAARPVTPVAIARPATDELSLALAASG